MKKLLLTTCALLVSFPAFAEDWWSMEEMKAGEKEFQYTRYVTAGRESKVHSLGFFYPSCVLADADNAITSEPEHGTVRIETLEEFASFPKDSSSARCNGKKFRMPVIIYKSAEGYTGIDTFETRSVVFLTARVLGVTLLRDTRVAAMRSGPSERYDFFLSRRGSVAAIAQEVADVLKEKGYRVRTQDYDIPITANFIEEMHEAVKYEFAGDWFSRRFSHAY